MTSRPNARALALRARRRRRMIRFASWTAGAALVALGFAFVGRGADGASDAAGAHPAHPRGGGIDDASRVVAPASFTRERAVNAYTIATRIPAVLNQLHCSCGCDAMGHRSNLACFEDQHGALCDVCMRTAEIAWRMTRKGVRNPVRIQAVIDASVPGM